MEFKFRAVEDRPPTYYVPSSVSGPLPDHAPRGASGYPIRSDPILRPIDVHEGMQREIEKQRIRQEIIAEEQRRIALEAEVRRELMMEREIARRMAEIEGKTLFEGRMGRLPLMPPHCDGFSFNERMPLARRSMLDLQPLSQLSVPPAATHEVNPPSMVNTDKVIMLAKPDQNLAGTKRKAVTVAGDLPLLGLEKPKQEWSCALCQVSATSERGLNEHLRGKKHKAKEAGLMKRNVGTTLGAQMSGKKSSSSLTPMGTEKPSKLKETNEKVEVELLHQINIDHPVEEAARSKKKKTNAEASKGHNVAATGRSGTGELKRKKFKFWCHICQIGTDSEKAMDGHKNGKKHRNRRLAFTEDSVAVPIRTIVPSSEPSQMVMNACSLTEETNEKNSEDVSAGSNGSKTSALEI